MGTYLQSSSLSYSYQNVIQITTKFTININTNQFSNAKIRFMKHLMKATENHDHFHSHFQLLNHNQGLEDQL